METKANGVLKNLTYLVLIIVLFAVGSMLLNNQLTQARTRFDVSPFLMTIIPIVFFGGIGVVLGLMIRGQLRSTKQQDTSGFLLITLPALIVSLSYVWASFGWLNDSVYQYIVVNDYLVIVASVILGFSIMSALPKKI
ncbi:hypothetical protein EL84_23680 [Paenibacillus sp. VT-400]|uniref:hypothetical protein n=1 Tax=Paenibacillus sp. VT-400 TaxID=1495853 RepID=UPI00064B2139|nr:hypothetical protein [Paenibacillus sp. VT-400]KLU55084.1 hypothetical protein EL84_23680 [Paenibacillus sp. VT-400]